MKKNRSLYKLLGVLISISMLFSLAPSVVAVEALEAAENALSEISENISAQAESYNSTAITVTEPSQDSDGYYLIGTAGELYWFAEYVNAGNSQVNAKLTADIVVNENLLESLTYDDEGNVTNGDSFNLWNPIGYRVSSSEGVAFSGVFDGQGYEISGLYYNNVTDGSYIGLFGNALSATIKNIGLVDSYIAAMQYVGGICGYFKDTSDAPGEISGCYNTSSIKGAINVAGICSYAGSYTVIRNCYNEGEITGFSITYNYDENTVLTLGGAAGGIMGFGRCSITDCYNTGDISGYIEIGGISGYSIGSVTRCYNTGNVSAEASQAGGIAGDSYDCITTDCYNTGNISAGTTCAGGINGRNQSDCSIVNCYNSGTVTGTTDCVGSIVGSATVASILPVNSYYLENTASLSDGTAMLGVGVAEGETPADTEGVTESKTAEEFASGEVTYLLNNGLQNGTQTWYQTLGVDDYPAFEGETVYFNSIYTDCTKSELVSTEYSNTEGDTAPHINCDENGFCVICGGYKQPSTDTEGYYLIGTAGELYWFAEYVNSGNSTVNAKLTADIVVNENLLESITYDEEGNITNADSFKAWTPMGNSDTVYFSGVFDGQGHRISGLFAYNYAVSYLGLFGYISGGTVKNVNIADSFLHSSVSYVGAICGYLYVESEISGCSNSGTVRGRAYVAGIAGIGAPLSAISNCYNTGSVTGTSNYVGGICGCMMGLGITNCYNTGSVNSSTYYVGGICGYANNSKITSCYNAGVVTGTKQYVGSIIGRFITTSQTRCYYLENTAFLSDGTAMLGAGVAEGETPADSEGAREVKTAEEFASGEVTYLLNDGVTDGTQIWYQTLETDEYPVFEGETVYNTYTYSDCSKKEVISEYSNSDSETVPDHVFSGSVCTVCGCYAQPKKNSDGYYLISNMGELYWLAEHVNSGNAQVNAKLTADIVVNENLLESITYDDEGNITNADSFKAWTPIGNSDTIYFSGVFDGQGHTISGLFAYNYATSYLGLFGYVSGGTITGINIADSFIHSSANYVGAICGYIADTTLSLCNNSGAITGSNFTAGICGNLYGESVISNCCNTGEITGSGLATGGVVGVIRTSSTATDCLNSGSVNGKSNAGGIVGILWGGTLENCYNTGTVLANNQYVGSICGRTTGSYSLANCYYLENTASLSDGTAMLGVGVASSETPADTEGVTESKTAEEFASGEVTYLLNDGVTDGTQAWYQTLETDAYPVFEGKTVYFRSIYTDCTKAELVSTEYSNKKGDIAPHINCDEEGFCVICGGYKEPTTQTSGDYLYYCIGTVGELYWFAEQVNSGDNEIRGMLTADIVVNENLLDRLEYDENGNVTNGDEFRQWTPIGYKNSESEVAFAGSFRGGDYVVSGLYFNDSTADYVGLFGYSTGTPYVSVTDSYIRGNNYVGGIAGHCRTNLRSYVNTYYFDGRVIGNDCVGGIIGSADTLRGFENRGQITGTRGVGGVAGLALYVYYCNNTGTVSGTEGVVSSRIGGVVGYAYAKCDNLSNSGDVTGTDEVGGVAGVIMETTVSNCSNSGKITSNTVELDYGYTSSIGGVIGDIDYYRGTITLCYNTGDVSGATYAGGICGSNNSSSLSKCYNTGDVYGLMYAGGIFGYNGKYKIKNAYNTGVITVGPDGDCGGISGCMNEDMLNCYSTVDPLGYSPIVHQEAQIMTEEDFASGKVAYLLNEGAVDSGRIWYQNIDLIGETPSPHPTFSGGTVYYVEKCKNIPQPTYSNYVHDGLCYTCGYDVPTLDNDNYYLISNASELYWFAKYVNETDLTANAKLVNDIIINPEIKYENKELVTDVTDFHQWKMPIGNYTADDTSKKYAGTFDGDGHSITGLYKEGTESYKGLFGCIAETGVVKNVSVVGSYFSLGVYVGGIAGLNDGLIENCSFVDSNIDTDHTDMKYVGDYVGGIAGKNTGTINNCCNTVYNTGENYILCGTLVGWYAGGIAGSSSGPINNCYSTAIVIADYYIGGICGETTGDCVDNSTNNFYITGNVHPGRSQSEVAFGRYSYDSYPDEGRATAYESIDAMSTGELAYLLQSANTEQVWGQKSNVIMSSYGFNRCLPVIDTTGVYKVVTVGETGNYSVANVGDTNGDGTVDVTDYQALVNKALADDHEQIETASYDDIIRYDLDGDGYLDVIDAYLLHLFINGFTTVDVYPPGDIDSSGVSFYNEEEILLVAEKIATPEKLSTSEKYACDMNADGKVNNEDLVILKEKYPKYFTTE